VANIQVTHDANVNNARSESSLVVNPNDPSQVVAASKRFNDIHTYDFTLATEWSDDGGQSWHDSAAFALPGGATVMTDPTMAWDDSGNVFMVGLVGNNPPAWNTIGIAIYKSTNGGKTWSAPKQIHTSGSDDKQWAAGDTNPGSPHHGNVYAVWDDSGGIDFARTKNHGTSWVGAGTGASPPIAATLADGCYYPEINVSDDGTVYVAAIAGSAIHLHVSTDGGDTFTAKPNPATGITPLGAALPAPHGFPVFPGGNFRVITDPTACAFGTTVTVAWADYRDGVSRIYYARSTDGGTTWTTGGSGQKLLTASFPSNFQHFHPQIVTDANGVIGCTFYEFGPKPSTYKVDVLMAQSFDGGATFNHFIVTDQPWDPTVDAPWSHGDSAVTFIGDYFGLDAGANGSFLPLWTDTRTGVQELFTAIVPERNLAFVVNRSTIGEDEVDARRQFAGPSAVIPDAFRVVVDGYPAAAIGVTGPSSTLPVASPVAGMNITCTGNVSSNGDYGPEVQRFTFKYDLDFGTDPNDPAFSFGGATKFVTLSAAVADVSGSGEIELIKQPDPFMLHGDPAWLSVDLRVFVMSPGESKFGHTMGSTAADAADFIQRVSKDLTTGNGTAAAQSFDDPSVLSPDEEGSALYVYPQNDSNAPVFNFALARVRYIGLIGANNVRVFFRLFQAQTTSGAYDFPPGASYRRAAHNPDGQPIPLAGIQGNEYVTLPFFALPRINTTTKKMDKQTDSHTVAGKVLGNVQHITAHANGSEVDTFFGCWLDINQPTSNVIPATVDAAHPDGPFQSVTNPPLPVQQAILKSLHQCLIAEVAFDPVTIPLGKDPGNWDKLAQRNLAWSDVGSAVAVTPFEIRPTPVGLAQGQRADELMIDWGETPHGSVATLFLPAASADEILDLASRMYASHHLTRLDDHTLQVPAGGITYVPIPPGSGPDYAGLLAVEPPENVKERGFTVVVRQVTNASAARLRRGELQEEAAAGAKKKKKGKAAEAVTQEGFMGRSEYDVLEWRRVLGAFQLTAPVRPKQTLLVREERQLSVLRWIAEAIPRDSRWHPVFERYVDVIGDRVIAFGGDPTRVLPSPYGWPKHEHEPHPDPGHLPPGEEREGHRGKIAGLLFDRFGDFEGFVLETDEGERRYFSRERDVEALAERAWRERLRVTVYAERDDPRRAASIMLWEPPVHV
jgi:hypothetical protein